MMEKKRLPVLILAISLCIPVFGSAETVVLKSGKTVEGKITEKTDNYIKMNFQGVEGAEITYLLKDIERIENAESANQVTTEPVSKSKSNGINKEVYYAKEHGLKLIVPQGWQVFDNKDPIKMRKAIPGIADQATVKGMICVIKKQLLDINPTVCLFHEYDGKERSIEQLNEDSKRVNLSNKQQDPHHYQIIENSNIITLNGNRFSKSITKAQGTYGYETSLNYYFVKGKGRTYYSLICSVAPSQFDSYKDLFEQIAASVEFETKNAEAAVEYYDRGVALGKQGKFPEAVSALTKAIEINPDYVEAYNERGFVYGLKQGKFPEAISDLTKVIEINPNHARAYNNRAIFYYYAKQYDKAWADVHKAKELRYPVKSSFLNELKKASGRGK